MKVKIGRSELPLAASLAALAGVLGACVVGTYLLTHTLVQGNEQALEIRLRSVEDARDQAVFERDRALLQLSSRYIKCKAGSASSWVEAPAAIPSAVAEFTPEAATVGEKLARLEAERRRLLNELQRLSNDAMSPGSDVAGLIAQLASGDPEQRKRACHALFELKGPLVFVPLAEYLKHHRSEALSVTSLPEYYHGMLLIDEAAGIQFLAHEMQRQDGKFDLAFFFLKTTVDDRQALEAAIPILKSMVVRSQDPVFRAKAKTLIQQYEAAL